MDLGQTFREHLEEQTGIYTAEPVRLETCQNCGKLVVQTYQKNFCNPCLVKIFQRLQPVINSVSNICNKSPLARLGL